MEAKVPDGWYARADGKRGGVPAQTVLQYLRHPNIFVVSSDGSRSLSCRTQLFLRLTGNVGLALVVRVPPEQIDAFRKQKEANEQIDALRKQEEPGGVLVAVMPFCGAMFDEFALVMTDSVNALQRLLLRCKLADMMCVSDRDLEANVIMEDLKLAVARMIGIISPEGCSKSSKGFSKKEAMNYPLNFCMTEDALKGPGYWWSSQLISEPCGSDDAGLGLVCAAEAESDEEEDCRGCCRERGEAEALIARVSCASHSWFASLVDIGSPVCKHKHVVPLSIRPLGASGPGAQGLTPLGANGLGRPLGQLVGYSYVDVNRMRDECEAFLGIVRHFSSYQHEEQVTASIKILCSHPILAQTLVIDPESVTELLLAKGSIDLKMLSQMLHMCAKVEVDNYVQLGLPVTETTPVWLGLRFMHKIFLLALRTPTAAVGLLDEFIGGGYLSELDLGSTVITGSAITFATVITANQWVQEADTPKLAHSMHKALYPCIYTVPESEHAYNELVRHYGQLADRRTDSHKIISVTQKNNNLSLLGPWKWSSENESLSSSNKEPNRFAALSTSKKNDAKPEEKTSPNRCRTKRRKPKKSGQWGLWTDIPKGAAADSDDSCSSPSSCRSRSASPNRATDHLEVTGHTMMTLEDPRPRTMMPEFYADGPHPSYYAQVAVPNPPTAPPPVHMRHHVIGGPDRQSTSNRTIRMASAIPLSSVPWIHSPPQPPQAAQAAAAAHQSASAAAAAMVASHAEEKNQVVAAAAPAPNGEKKQPICAASKKADLKTEGKADEKVDERVEAKADEKAAGAIDLGDLTLEGVLAGVEVTWTLIDGAVLSSSKFSLSLGADLQLMVLSGDLEKVALQHLAKIRARFPGARLLRQTKGGLCYWVIDPSNLGSFRMVRIYAGTYHDIVKAPVGMTRAAYSRPCGFFGTPSFICSAIHSRSPNYVLRGNANLPQEFLFKYKMRGFSWPETIQGQKMALKALKTWGASKPNWKRYTKSSQPKDTVPPAATGVGRFNFDTIL